MANTVPKEGIAFEEAIAIVKAKIKPINRVKSAFLADSHMRILAEDIIAPANIPSFPSSAMDGYAVNLTSDDETAAFRVIGQSLAGHPFLGAIENNEAVRVFTGSLVPAGTDAIVVQEVVKLSGSGITFPRPKKGEFIRRAGINVEKGGVIAQRGARLDGRVLSQIAAGGITRVRVASKLKVAIANTGDELVDIGMPLENGQIYNTNRWYLFGRVLECHNSIYAIEHIPDDLASTETYINNLTKHSDLVILTGGASVGDADFVRVALENLGTVHFNRVASRPGKPFAFATINNTPVFSLPGNPASVAVGFEQIVKPAMDLLQGSDWREPMRINAIAEVEIAKQRGRLEFQRGICTRKENQLFVRPLSSQDSAIGTSLVKANCFIVIAAETGLVKKGDSVQVELYHGHF